MPAADGGKTEMERSLQSSSGKEKTVSTGNKDLWLLNVLRGVSAILIVLYHYTTQYDKSIGHVVPYPFTIPWGCYAVYTFFMLSGFLTVYSCKRNANAVSFLKKRFFRLYPMFWICMTVTTLYMFAIMSERAPSLTQFLLNLTMIPSFFGVEAVDGVYWTMAKELFFYFGFAVVLQLGLFKKDKANWLWGWLCVAILAAGYCYEPYHLPFRGVVSLLLMPEYIFAFLAGCAVFYLIMAECIREKVAMTAYMLICITLCFWMKSREVTVFFMSSLGALIICSQSRINEKMLPLKRAFWPVLYLSGISYELYLTHQFIGFGIIQMMENHGLTEEIWIIIPIIHSIVLSTVLHFLSKVQISKG